MAARARAAIRRRARTARRGLSTRRVMSLLALVVFVAGWALLLRPTALGGPATFVVVSGSSMEPTMHTGDLVVLRDRESYAVGDVVTYRVPEGAPGAGRLVIHRVTGGSASSGYVTQGDNRDRADEWSPTADEVEGSQWFMVPRAGAALARLADPPLLAALAGGAVVVFVLLGGSSGDSGPTRPGRVGAEGVGRREEAAGVGPGRDAEGESERGRAGEHAGERPGACAGVSAPAGSTTG